MIGGALFRPDAGSVHLQCNLHHRPSLLHQLLSRPCDVGEGAPSSLGQVRKAKALKGKYLVTSKPIYIYI